MLICCTKKLQTELKITPEEIEGVNPLFSWHANVLIINRKKAVVLVNDLTQYSVVLYGLKAKDFKRFGAVALSAIQEAFQAEGIKEDVISHYIQQAQDVQFAKTTDRTSVARMNKSSENAQFFDDLLNEGTISQPSWSLKTSRFLVGRGPRNYICPNEEMYKSLAKLSGQPIFDSRAVVLNVTLRLKNYKVWRRLAVPITKTFQQLHTILQTAFGWQNSHLHDFTIYDNDSSKPIVNLVCDEEALSYPGQVEQKLEEGLLLSDYLVDHKKLLYIYDFGDNWQHLIEVEQFLEEYEFNHATCLDGEGDSPPEDVGGEGGFQEYLRILADPTDPEYEHMKAWGQVQRSPEFEKNIVNVLLKNS